MQAWIRIPLASIFADIPEAELAILFLISNLDNVAKNCLLQIQYINCFLFVYFIFYCITV